jgi:hypothetical protein
MPDLSKEVSKETLFAIAINFTSKIQSFQQVPIYLKKKSMLLILNYTKMKLSEIKKELNNKLSSKRIL